MLARCSWFMTMFLMVVTGWMKEIMIMYMTVMTKCMMIKLEHSGKVIITINVHCFVHDDPKYFAGALIIGDEDCVMTKVSVMVEP